MNTEVTCTIKVKKNGIISANWSDVSGVSVKQIQKMQSIMYREYRKLARKKIAELHRTEREQAEEQSERKLWDERLETLKREELSRSRPNAENRAFERLQIEMNSGEPTVPSQFTDDETLTPIEDKENRDEENNDGNKQSSKGKESLETNTQEENPASTSGTESGRAGAKSNTPSATGQSETK